MNLGQPTGQSPLADAVAKEAFIYGFPIVAGYETLYKQAVDLEVTGF
jgi:hypothetical protein